MNGRVLGISAVKKVALSEGAPVRRILIAEDVPIVRRLVRRLLESHAGWTVCGEAGDGEEALRMAESLHPDVVILDVIMPTMNGLEAAAKLATILPDVPVLMLSAHDVKQFYEFAKAAGARGYVSKSSVPLSLTEAVETVLSNGTYFPQLPH